MARQLTTSLSDLVLALSVLHFVYCVFWDNLFAAIGLSIQGAAAGIGVYRFALSRPDQNVTVSIPNLCLFCFIIVIHDNMSNHNFGVLTVTVLACELST